MALLDLMIDLLRRLATSGEGDHAAVRLSTLSYNIVMTDQYIHVVPRIKESYVLESGEEVSINSLGFAGMILTKSQEALEGVQKAGVLTVLSTLGFPPVEMGDTTEAEEL